MESMRCWLWNLYHKIFNTKLTRKRNLHHYKHFGIYADLPLRRATSGTLLYGDVSDQKEYRGYCALYQSLCERLMASDERHLQAAWVSTDGDYIIHVWNDANPMIMIETLKEYYCGPLAKALTGVDARLL